MKRKEEALINENNQMIIDIIESDEIYEIVINVKKMKRRRRRKKEMKIFA